MGRHITRSLAAILVAAGATALVLISLVGAVPSADAQLSCTGETTRDVSTAAEFNDAIDCHNNGPIPVTNISLLNDIAATGLANESVFTQINGFDNLIIIGNGYTLSRAATAPTTTVPLLSVGGAGGRVQFIETGIEVGEFDTHGIEHTGSKTLQLIASSIQPGPSGSTATGVLTASDTGAGQFLMTGSFVQGIPVGLRIESQTYSVETSTIFSTARDIELATTGLGGFFSSTLAGPVGIELTSGGTRVEHSTILGDGAVVSATVDENSYVTFFSSIVESCSADQLLTATQPGPGWVDIDYNAGQCFGGPSAAGLLSEPACATATPAGCPYVAELSSTSPARNAGRCDQSSVDFTVERDQRGQLRTPNAEGCDSGAFESGCALDSGQFEIRTERDLVAAIECGNTPFEQVSGTRFIFADLKNDIVASSVAGASVFPRLEPQISGAGELAFWIVSDDGYTISRGPEAPTAAADLFNFAGDELAVKFIRIDLVVGEHELSAMRHEGSGSLDFEISSITAGPSGTSATGMISDGSPAGAILLGGSLIDGLEVGISTGIAGSVFLDASTINTAGTALALDDGTTEIVNSTLVAPIAVELSSIGTVRVSNSTVIGDGALIPDPDFAGTISYRSSIVTDCSSAVVDEGGNVGNCFDPGTIVDTVLAENSCSSEPSFPGCVLTVALSPDALAIGQGDCTDFVSQIIGDGFVYSVTFDQRGVQRTPQAIGCDAGAFEADSPVLGDVNADGVVDNADVQALLDWLAGGAEPALLMSGELTGDDVVKLDDALSLAQLVAGN